MSRPAPTQARSRKTQQDLIDALGRLLSDQSIGELSVSAIASEAGVTTGAIYRRFKDKQDLLRAAFDHFLEKTIENSTRIAAEAEDLSDRELLRRVIEGTLNFTLEHIGIMRAAASLNDLPSFERMRSARDLVAEELARQITTSSLTRRELGRRTRFTTRIVTAVGRDTFLAGPGAGRAGSGTGNSTNRRKHSIDQLVTDLLETSVSYLKIE